MATTILANPRCCSLTLFTIHYSPLTNHFPMSLTENQKKHLRRLAHPLHPVVMVGSAVGEAGKLEAITTELDGALTAHELVKVRARLDDRAQRDEIFSELGKR